MIRPGLGYILMMLTAISMLEGKRRDRGREVGREAPSRASNYSSRRQDAPIWGYADHSPKAIGRRTRPAGGPVARPAAPRFPAGLGTTGILCFCASAKPQ
jgi:hypothetical protein